jgi:hypothetical protein
MISTGIIGWQPQGARKGTATEGPPVEAAPVNSVTTLDMR